MRFALVCFTPTPPEEATLHGAPTVTTSTADAIPLLICNTGNDPIEVPADAPLAYLEGCQSLEAAPQLLAAPATGGGGRGGGDEEKSTDSGKKPAEKTTQQQMKNRRVEEYFDLASAEANWSRQQFKELKEVLRKSKAAWEAPEIVGRAKQGEHRIDTGDALPVALPLRRVAWVERDVIQKEVQKMKEQNIIVDSDSPWSSPPVLVKKKDGTVRFCIDYRKLNEVTVADKYLLPRIGDVLDELGRGVFFSVIDLKAGYWQIPMRKGDAEKTAFRTADGHYQFTVMPFGLRNAPATFQRMMDVVFSGIKWKGLMVYMDDIVIYSATAREHIRIIDQVLQKLMGAGLKINPAKTTLVAHEVKYLGHVISADGVKPNPAKIHAVTELKAPRTAREVKMFLGLVSYYRRFIPSFASLALPLNELTRGGAKYEWNQRQQTAFELLKKKLCESPILEYPRRGRQNIIDCDASDEAAGAVLMQRTSEGREVVIQYASYTFSEVERRWPAMEKEAYAVVWAVTTFRAYILGQPVIIRTDNTSAATLKKAKHAKLQRWAMTLEDFDYELQYRPGKKQSHVDALSRLPTKTPRLPAPEAADLHPAATAFLAETRPQQHPSLPVLDWAQARKQDMEFVALKAYLTKPEAAGVEPPQWFKALPRQQQARFCTDREDIVYRDFPPRDRLRRGGAARSQASSGCLSPSWSLWSTHWVTKTNAMLSLRFYWPCMVDTVKLYVRSCGRCQRAKAAPRILRVGRMLNREALWSTVAFDFFGPLPKSRKGYRYILVGIDHFSRWPEAVATRYATAKVVAEFFHSRIIAQHGAPRELLTDHGTHFASQVISTLCRQYQVRRLMSTPYTPQSNGIVERFMGYLKNALITLVDNHPTRWDQYLASVIFAYRTTPHPEVGDTPFFMNRGYDPRIPEFLTVNVPADKTADSPDWLEKLESARTGLQRRIAEQQEQIRQRIKEQESPEYEAGQLVLVKKTPAELQQAHTKLTDRYDHPARVVHVLPNGVSYKITFLRTGMTSIVNRRQLKPLYDDSDVEDDVLTPAQLPIAKLDDRQAT